MRESRGSKNLKQFNHRAYIRKGFVFEKYMNMCADSENNALFNSGPLNKHALLGHPVSENFVSWCQTLKNSSASFLCIQETYYSYIKYKYFIVN
jgi:hypothetical protein